MGSIWPQQGFRDQLHRRLRGFVNLLQVRFSGIVVGHPGEQQLGESENDRELIAQIVSEPVRRLRLFQGNPQSPAYRRWMADGCPELNKSASKCNHEKALFLAAVWRLGLSRRHKMVVMSNPDHHHSADEERRIREAALDETIAESFPASDPPSSLPNPDDHEAVENEPEGTGDE